MTRDSNSGSARGFDELLQLLYADSVQYLIGPEETALATAIVPDIKALDILNILPGYAAPAIEYPGGRGAWVRLAPSTTAFSCAMGEQVVRAGANTVNVLSTTDDYNASPRERLQQPGRHRRWGRVAQRYRAGRAVVLRRGEWIGS